MHGYSSSQRYGKCDICLHDHRLLGTVNCPGYHCACVSCFIKLKQQMRQCRPTDIITCHMCRGVITTFTYIIKVEDQRSDPKVVINVYD
jgi:hypothetical protein